MRKTERSEAISQTGSNGAAETAASRVRSRAKNTAPASCQRAVPAFSGQPVAARNRSLSANSKVGRTRRAGYIVQLPLKMWDEPGRANHLIHSLVPALLAGGFKREGDEVNRSASNSQNLPEFRWVIWPFDLSGLSSPFCQARLMRPVPQRAQMKGDLWFRKPIDFLGSPRNRCIAY